MPTLRERLPLVTTLLVILVGSVFLLTQARHLYFFGDDWMFLLERDLSERPLEDLMTPHNEHWSALPVLLYRALFSVVGVDHFPVFAVLPILAHAGVCFLFFLLLRRCTVHPWIAAGVTTVLVFLGAGAENLLWAFQVGMIGSAVLGLGALLVSITSPRRRSVGVVWLLLVLSLMTASTAIPMVLWLGAFTLLRDGLRRALVLTVPPALVWAAWFVVWGRDADTGIATAAPADVIPMAWRGLSATWDTMSGFTGAGPALVVGLLVAALVLHPGTDGRRLALSAWAAVFTTYLIIAHSRGEFGPDAATESRYAYFGALLTLPSLALVLDTFRERLRERPIEGWLTTTVLLGLLVVPGAFQVVEWRVVRDAQNPDLRGQVLAARELARSGELLLREQVDPVWNPNVTVAALRSEAVSDALADDPFSARDMLTARAALQVDASPSAWGLLTNQEVSVVGTPTTPSGDCVIGLGAEGAMVVVPSEEVGGEVRLILSGTDRTTVRLRDSGVSGARVPLILGDGAGAEVYVGVVAPDLELLIDLPPGTPFTVCDS
ncbi:hypothetical protein [Nocardioides sp.]|uniref:hypothetical protein n=1 Tax=Nocardioides sp. TaxID=35761 RepID=UPI002CC5AF69|nr:hypothetical protein [Nocardioides sp.]HXH79022.1 hypothetical protein [Nocardioides sp.]